MPRAKKPKPADIAHIVEQLRPLAVPVDTIHPDPENARIHPDRNVETIKESIRLKGMDQPVVVRKEDMMLAKGHGRLQAVKELGHKWIPAVVVEESRVSAVERAIVDNRASDQAENDNTKLMKLLDFVTSNDGTPIGWTDAEMAELMLDAEKAAASAAEEGGKVDPPDPSGEAGRSVPGVVFKADVVFDDAEQQGRWHTFVRKLRKIYPDKKTLGARIDAFLVDQHDIQTP